MEKLIFEGSVVKHESENGKECDVQMDFLDFLNSSKRRGWFGEKLLALLLNILPKEEYDIINDVLIVDDKGSHQIDHMVLSRYGLFVIENKDYSGWIFGSTNNRNWTQSLYGKKYKFLNPIMQNAGHIKALQKLLGKDVPLISIIAFSGDSTLKTSFDDLPERVHVGYWGDIRHFIFKYQTLVLSTEELQHIKSTITSAHVPDKQARRDHVDAIHAKIKEKKEAEEAGTCPRCGRPLVKRNGKYGVFWGCSGYPGCRFTRKGG